jgi:hypothetical protein
MLCNRGGRVTRCSCGGLLLCCPQRLRGPLRLIVGAVAYHGPGYAGRLVRQRHAGDVDMTSSRNPLDPAAQSVILVLATVDDRARTVYQQLAQV